MSPARYQELIARYDSLRVAVVGDFCLDRYLEIDPARQERSIETSLPVHNVVKVRPQAGAAGTIVNNLSALGIGSIYPLGLPEPTARVSSCAQPWNTNAGSGWTILSALPSVAPSPTASR